MQINFFERTERAQIADVNNLPYKGERLCRRVEFFIDVDSDVSGDGWSAVTSAQLRIAEDEIVEVLRAGRKLLVQFDVSMLIPLAGNGVKCSQKADEVQLSDEHFLAIARPAAGLDKDR